MIFILESLIVAVTGFISGLFLP
ncbi:hypothetical protein [Marinitoga lauensis]